MAITLRYVDRESGASHFKGLSSDTKGSGTLTLESGDTSKYSMGSTFTDEAGNVYTWYGAWVQTSFGGAVGVSGLGTSQIQVTAGTYAVTEILGFEVFNVGSAGNWSWTALNGGVATIGFGDMTVGIRPVHASTITVPTGGIAVLWIPS